MRNTLSNSIRKFIVLPFVLMALISTAQINKVEHFFVSSPNAEKLFNFFRDTFQLPVIWKFQKWGDFASGGMSLGNVVFEFVIYKGVTETKFDGIALEPKQHLDNFIPVLDERGIAHDTIENNTSTNASGVLVGWSNLLLTGLLPAEAHIFICDYVNREAVFTNRKTGSDSLKFRNGGPLGIIAVQELVIATNEFERHTSGFSKLPGVMKETNDLFSFNTGPSIRLVRSTTPAIKKIVIKVKSIPAAKKYLASKTLLGRTTKTSIFVDETVIDGLEMELID